MGGALTVGVKRREKVPKVLHIRGGTFMGSEHRVLQGAHAEQSC